jgi:hypothetical protein
MIKKTKAIVKTTRELILEKLKVQFPTKTQNELEVIADALLAIKE